MQRVKYTRKAGAACTEHCYVLINGALRDYISAEREQLEDTLRRVLREELRYEH